MDMPALAASDGCFAEKDVICDIRLKNCGMFNKFSSQYLDVPGKRRLLLMQQLQKTPAATQNKKHSTH